MTPAFDKNFLQPHQLFLTDQHGISSFTSPLFYPPFFLGYSNIPSFQTSRSPLCLPFDSLSILLTRIPFETGSISNSSSFQLSSFPVRMILWINVATGDVTWIEFTGALPFWLIECPGIGCSGDRSGSHRKGWENFRRVVEQSNRSRVTGSRKSINDSSLFAKGFVQLGLYAELEKQLLSCKSIRAFVRPLLNLFGGEDIRFPFSPLSAAKFLYHPPCLFLALFSRQIETSRSDGSKTWPVQKLDG